MPCLDYLCPELEQALGRKSLIRLQTVSGEEIMSAFLLQEATRETLKRTHAVSWCWAKIYEFT